MGASQICVNAAVSREEEIQKEHPHAPNPEIYPEVGDYPASLPCGINHVRQQLASRSITPFHAELQPPPDYRPAPFKKDSFFELVKDTAYYRGQWCNGEPEGQGEVIFRDRSYFRGFFKEMQASGPECLFVLSDGAYYLGQVAHSKRVGHGQFIDHGYSYDGEWLNNLPHGKGKETFPNGDSFQGRFLQGLRSGSGIYTWASGPYLRFQGHFDGNMFGQKGVLITREGAEVQGQFDCGEQFDIAPCTIKTPKFLVKNCIVNDGNIESLVFQKRSFLKSQQGRTLKRKKLIHCSEIDEKTVSNIIEAIEAGYRKASKHSQALEQIRKELPGYSCEWWKDGQAKSGLLIAEICGKKIQISKK